MNRIHLRQTLPQVFADRDAITSDVWHRDITFHKGKRYLIEAASGTGKSSLCSYVYGYRNDYQGIINFDERNIRSLSVNDWTDIRKHSLSILFQELRIFPELTAIENIQLKNRLTNFKKRKEVLTLFEASVSFCSASLVSLSLVPALSANDFKLTAMTCEASEGITLVYSGFLDEQALISTMSIASTEKWKNRFFFI
jgi:ABC-type sugar transport system ATPase subunit